MTITRRTMLAAAAVALTEMGIQRNAGATPPCTTGVCSGNQTCCPGYTCKPDTAGYKRCTKDAPPKPPPVPPSPPKPPVPPFPPAPPPTRCVVDSACGGGGAVCHQGTCCSVIVIDTGDVTQIVYVPITIIEPPAPVPVLPPAPVPAPVPLPRRHRKHRKHRRH